MTKRGLRRWLSAARAAVTNHGKANGRIMEPDAAAVTIRPAREEDLAAIYEINRIAWDGVCVAQLVERRHGVIGGIGWQQRKAQQVDHWCRANLDCVVAAEAAGRVVGFAAFSFDREERAGEVLDNAVHPEWRNRGIGTALIAAVVRRLLDAGATVLRVNTLEHDVAAQAVYRKLGFRELVRSIRYTMSAADASAALERLERAPRRTGSRPG